MNQSVRMWFVATVLAALVIMLFWAFGGWQLGLGALAAVLFFVAVGFVSSAILKWTERGKR